MSAAIKEGAVTEDLYGAYANPAVNITAEELEAAQREFGTAWEAEMAELFDEQS